MEAIASYVLRLCCGALICGLIQTISGKTGPTARIRQMVCAIYLAFLAISPLRDLDPEMLTRSDPDWIRNGEELAAEGATQAEIAYAQLISEQYESYIQTKAKALSLSLDVSLELDPDTGQLLGVELIGSATPYEKSVLENAIEADLGVERSRIRWTP